MPLRDHFRPPLSDQRSWEGLHGGWPMMIVQPQSGNCPGVTSPSRRSIWAHPSRSTWRPTRRTRPISPPRPSSGGRRRGRDRGLGAAAADAGRRDRPAGAGRVRGARLRHQVGPPAGGRRRDRQPGQQGPARAPPRLRRQVRRLAPGARLRRDRRSRHDAHANLYGDLLELLGQTDPVPRGRILASLRRRLPLGEEGGRVATWRPGCIP